MLFRSDVELPAAAAAVQVNVDVVVDVEIGRASCRERV